MQSVNPPCVKRSLLKKFELIDCLEEGQTTGANAWLLKWDKTESEWIRTDKQRLLYGDCGWRGVGFGGDDSGGYGYGYGYGYGCTAMPHGDCVDGHFDTESERWYAVGAGRTYLRGRAAADIPQGGSGAIIVILDTEGTEFSLNADSPHVEINQDDPCWISWNHGLRRWDAASLAAVSGWGTV